MIAEKEIEIAKYHKRLSKEQVEEVSEESLKSQFDSVVEKAYHNAYREYSLQNSNFGGGQGKTKTLASPNSPSS